jgi:tRNA dimethylallyltransferase
MFAHGLVEEAGGLIERYGHLGGALDSLGYRQAVELLDGKLTREAAISAAQQGHRNYAKRQMTWFRREPGVHWIHGFGDDLATVSKALDLVSRQIP